MQNKIKLSLVCVTLFTSLHANETKQIELQPLEVTSTAIKTDELKSTDAVEVYTQKDIQESHSKDVYEFLNKETSVISMPSYGNPFTQKLDMRGYGIGDGYQNIVIKVNGRKLNNIDMIPQLLSSISPNQIQRIEIIKSSGVVEGGDGANAGVINIVTKKSNNKEVGFYAGIYKTFDGNFYVGHKDDKLSFSVNGEAKSSDGIREVDNDGNKNKNKLANFGIEATYTPTQRLELRANALVSKTEVTYGGSLTKDQYKDNPYQKGDNSNEQIYESDVIGAGASFFINDALSLNGDFSHEFKKSQYTYKTNGAYPYIYESESTYVYNSYDLNLLYEEGSFNMKLGIDGFRGKRDSKDNDTSKYNDAAYIMARYVIGANSFKAGYRYEQITYDNKPSTGSSLKDDDHLDGIELGYNYAFDKEMSLFVNYSKSYQSPDIDRFFTTPWGQPTQFNGFIEPSKANNYTIGYNYITKQNKLKVSIYYTDLKDEIYLYKHGYTYKNTNIDKSHKYGLDLYDKYIINKQFNVMLNYSYVQAIIDDEKEGSDDYSGNKLPGVSDHNIKASINYLPTSHTTISLSEVYRSEAYAANDFNNDFDQKQEEYSSTDISITYAETKWEVFAKVNNLFNQKNGLWIKDDAIYPVNFTTTAYVGFKLKY